MEPGVATCLLWPLSDIFECLQLLLQVGALLFQDQEGQITLDFLTSEARASLWHPHPRVERPLWRLDTSTDWWDRMVLGQWDDQQWLRNFHMQKRTFMELCAWLTPALQRDTTRLRAPNPIKKRVSIAVWKLATTDSYRSVAHQFGVGRSTVGIVMMEVVHAINDILLPRVIHLRDVDTTIAGFAALGFPNCGGVLDATHIPVWAPEHRAMAVEGQAYEQPHTAASRQAHQDGVHIREALTDMFSQAPE
nr:protein ANTAGONIST OF LIKE HETEROCHROMATIN PROTEIN 1-like [Pelodiscus sinensis]|eukprot:XP_025037658.1 protein ANTAGONIST OF LIKE HETEROCHROMATIN PROTEIN 1-like [Pelodiscus sinensis]